MRRQDIAAASAISKLVTGNPKRCSRLKTVENWSCRIPYSKYLTHIMASSYLPFLRPLALPKASTLQRFLSTAASSSSTSFIPSKTSSPTESTSSTQDSGPESYPSSRPTSPLLSYRVNRTPTANLPIYLLAKRGGNLKQTKLRKIEGDINTLRVHLRDALNLEDKEITINQLTKHIIIRVSYERTSRPLWRPKTK